MSEKLLDLEDKPNALVPKAVYRKLLVILISLEAIVLVSSWFSLAYSDIVYNLDGTVADLPSIRKATIMSYLVFLPISCTIPAFLVAIFPYDGVKYWRRYWRALILSMIFFLVLAIAGEGIRWFEISNM